jgi:putative MATE family efflux protein
METKSFTEGNIVRGMLRFSVPYLITCFLQTFYGMADLFIVGQFNAPASISAVAVGSQLMHMLTVVIAGFAMGSTVLIGRSVGAGNRRGIAGAVSTTFAVFAALAAGLTVILLLFTNPIIVLLKVPAAAVPEAAAYMRICFWGVVFITAYNVVSAVFRGLGDTRRPMYYVAAAGILNIGLDWLLVGPLGMGAGGAALATVVSQGVSVLLGLIALKKYHGDAFHRGARPDRDDAGRILGVGVPIALQEGLIQISFLVITMIANSRGVEVAAAVGIVEKVISFLFLVPSAMLSTVSALSAQNAGAGRHDRSRQVLCIGCLICAGFGAVVFVLCQPLAPHIVSLFVKQGDNVEAVVRLGGQYLRTYSLDCMLAGIHFCFSGFFSAYGKSGYSFLHNIISIITFRIPGAWAAAVLFPQTLYAMGIAAPMGSLLSVVICLVLYRVGRKNWGGA